jgi:hypothetical protein
LGLPTGGVSGGSSGSNRSHCQSVNSKRAMPREIETCAMIRQQIADTPNGEGRHPVRCALLAS